MFNFRKKGICPFWPQFTGSLPVSLSNTSELRCLQLDRNNFTGKLSINFGALPRFEGLFIQSNNLGSGDADEMDFFQSLANCSNLLKLDFMDNQFKGKLPNVLGNFSTQLNFFSMGQNFIFGQIPLGFGNLINLNMLEMGGDEFTGTIPSDIVNMRKLENLLLNDNRLSGTVPSN